MSNIVQRNTSISGETSENRGTSARQDLLASLVVFLIAVPLSLGIALASGAPILSGLIAAAVGGIIVGLTGGSPLLVSGPAAGLTVIVFGYIQQFGWQAMCAITVMAGLIQIALGLLRVGKLTLAISPAVVHGMLAGIGALIVLAQLHVVLGGKPESSGLKNIHALPGQIADLHGPATLLGLFTIGILFAWRYAPKALKSIPGGLVAVGVATLVSLLLHLDVPRVHLPDTLTPTFALPHLTASQIGPMLIAALTMAIVASTESLLSAAATDKLHTGTRSNLDRELVGQGLGNTVSGLLGGLPVTGVIVRSAANIGAGAKTRASAILHGVWVILFVALLGGVIEAIPLSVLAGLLVWVGSGLIVRQHIQQLISHREAAIYFITFAGVVCISLLTGVLLGVGLAILLLLKRLASTKIRVEHKEETWHVRMEGALTFVAVPEMTKSLGAIPIGVAVDVDLMVEFMDHAAFEALHGWRMMHEKLGGRVDIDERHEGWYEKREQWTQAAKGTVISAATPA